MKRMFTLTIPAMLAPGIAAGHTSAPLVHSLTEWHHLIPAAACAAVVIAGVLYFRRGRAGKQGGKTHAA